MKRVVVCMLLTGCWGYASLDNEAVCQPKKIHHNTPMICNNYDSVDVSMGVMRNGVGSMSTQDITLAFSPSTQVENEEKLKQAIAKGKLVRLTYSERRFSWCQEEGQVTKVEIIETSQEIHEDAEQERRSIQEQIEKLRTQLDGG